MPRYKLLVEYEGTNYCGWQRQSAIKPSIQQSIEEAIFNLTAQEVTIAAAGRTDAGVHALGQVAHCELDIDWPCDKLRQAVNAHLKFAKHNIRVIAVEKVGSEFHARFSAIKRYYRYLILNRPSESPLLNNKAWHIFKPLNIQLMQEASEVLIGKHDFTSFRAKQCQAKNPIITLDYIKICKQDDLILIEVAARSFLHHMVRNIVGSLKKIGEGKLSKNELKEILESCDRNLAPATAPAQGLYFLKVDY